MHLVDWICLALLLLGLILPIGMALYTYRGSTKIKSSCEFCEKYRPYYEGTEECSCKDL